MDKYKEAVDALNNLQSNAAYIKERSNLKISYQEEYQRFLQMKKFLTSAGISREKLNTLQVIHVAGTKGKGSTCAFVRVFFDIMGINGFYSSPHLLEVRERIRIDGEPISHDMFAQNFWYIYNRLSKDFPENLPVYFRFLTIMAFHIFLKEKVDVAVIEVGIGGELDCTNVLERVPVVGITSLGIDHTNLLGSTIEEIAWHKSGIFKENCKAYTMPQSPNAMKVLLERSKERKTSIEVVHPFVTIKENGRSIPDVFNLNASLAVTLAYSWMKSIKGINISLEEFADHPSTKQGLANFTWPGRYQIIFHDQVNYYLDGAHTPESMEICIKWFKAATKKSTRIKVLIFNMTGERDVEKILKRLLHCDFYKVYFVPNISGRNGSTDNKIKDVNIHINKCNKHRKLWIELLRNNNIGVDESRIITKLSVHDAVKEISQKPYDCLVTGSLHLMGAALDVLDPDLQQTHNASKMLIKNFVLNS
ncbi:folylpolyglutamate synthase-related [Holotrichia oblita]|uniref:Folylpolyglutamate synthase-related n=1 Tax=Holotrichia oblita TaxID=644536 RepID=A0ACB9SZM7_HOLOL|nr:folylpolyglutamate synthase-related [Holotrichia oblita]